MFFITSKHTYCYCIATKTTLQRYKAAINKRVDNNHNNGTGYTWATNTQIHTYYTLLSKQRYQADFYKQSEWLSLDSQYKK